MPLQDRSRPAILFPDVTLLPPCIPSKIVAVGLNYRDHAAELGFPIPDEPIIFLKPPTAVIGPGRRHPSIRRMSRRVDYEAELGVVIKDRIRNISPGEAPEHILGYTCANDVTARDLQKKDGQWTRAKSFDTFCPVGPWIETDLDPDDLLVEAYLNGERKQSSRTSKFIFEVPYLVSFISRDHDALSRRPDHHRHSVRHRPDAAGRRDRGADRGNRES